MKLLSLFALFAFVLVGCSSPEPNTATTPSEAAKSSSAAEPLRVALVPSEDAEKMVEDFEPVRAQLEKDLGRPVTMEKVTDYSSVIEAMRGGKVDIAWYGPLSMVLANQETGAEPFVIAKVKGKGLIYHSLILVKADSPIQTLADLKGKKMALVDPGSTSGNLVPRSILMKEVNQKPEDFFGELVYAGSHDASLLALASGSVDACAVQDISFEDKVAKKEIEASQYRILAKSDPIPASPFGHRKDLDPELLKKIIESFTTMDERKIPMDIQGQGEIESFDPVTMAEYEPIAQMARTLGLTKAEMSK